MNALKMFIALVFVIVIIAVLPGMAIAVWHRLSRRQRGTPTPSPNSSGGSSGSGSGGSSYSAPSFQPFVMSLLSSNGSVIGTVTGKSEYSIILGASNNTSIDGKNFTLSMYAEMGQKPSDDTRMDIDLLAPYSSGLPVGMNGATVLGVVNITRYGGSGWNLKLNTLKLMFSVPGTPGTDPNITYYLVRYDGASYYTQEVSLKDSSAGTLTFEMTPPSDSGLFTLVMSQPFIPTPTPTDSDAAAHVYSHDRRPSLRS